MPGRSYTSQSYRYGFNSHERDDEIKGIGNSYDFGARFYDPRLGKFMSTDPWEDKYPWQSSYAYFKNSPISQIDWKGFGDDKKTATNPNNSSTIHTEKVKLQDDQASVSPISDPVVSSDVGARDAPIAGASSNHPGMDIVQLEKGAVEGQDVVAPVNMKVLSINSASDGNGAGNRIHAKAEGDGLIRTFMHLESEGFGGGYKIGQVVPRGQKIGQVGNTGNSGGAHLHFEIRDRIAGGTVYNPRNKNSGLMFAPTTGNARRQNMLQIQKQEKIMRTPGHSTIMY